MLLLVAFIFFVVVLAESLFDVGADRKILVLFRVCVVDAGNPDGFFVFLFIQQIVSFSNPVIFGSSGRIILELIRSPRADTRLLSLISLWMSSD